MLCHTNLAQQILCTSATSRISEAAEASGEMTGVILHLHLHTHVSSLCALQPAVLDRGRRER
jgi:hypothetical protein